MEMKSEPRSETVPIRVPFTHVEQRPNLHVHSFPSGAQGKSHVFELIFSFETLSIASNSNARMKRKSEHKQKKSKKAKHEDN